MHPNSNIWIAMIALGSIILFLLIMVIVLKKRGDEAIKELKAANERHEYDMHRAQITSLHSQINPHFLYNTLEVIRSEALINQDVEAAQMAEALASYFRYNISLHSDVVSLGAELDNVDHYIMIQRKRFGNRVNYEVVYHSDIDEARGAQIPKLSLQPLVENSIFHGLEKKAKGGTVAVHITVTEKRLIITVIDDGVGMSPDEVNKLNDHISKETVIAKDNIMHGGIALINVNKRIRMMYGSQYGLSFSSVEGMGTEAELTMPYST